MKKDKQRKNNIIKALKQERNSYRDIVEAGKPYFKKYIIPEVHSLPVNHITGTYEWCRFDNPPTEDFIRKEIAYKLTETFEPMLVIEEDDSSNPYNIRYKSDIYISFGEGELR